MQDRIEIRELPARRLFGVVHRGSYRMIAEAFSRLHDALEGGQEALQEGSLIAIYDSDPRSTTEADLRSFAAVEVDETARLPDGLEERRLPAGPAAVLAHHGSYETLPEAWDALTHEWLPASGRQVGGVPYELYHNTPEDTAPDALITDVHVPLVPQ